MTAPRGFAAAAAELGVSEQWLRDNTSKVPLPHHKFSVSKDGSISDRGRGAVVFYDDDIAAIRAMFAVRAPGPVTAPARPLTRRRSA